MPVHKNLMGSIFLCWLVCLNNFDDAAAACSKSTGKVNVKVEVDIKSSSAIVKRDFLSLMIGAGKVRSNWYGVDFTSSKLINLATALGPTNIRLGGNSADFLTFVGNEPAYIRGLSKFDKFSMNGNQWIKFTTFAKKVGFEVMFNFNVMKRYNSSWDPSNAIELLTFSNNNNITISEFQLGNEPRSYKRKFDREIMPAQLATDMKKLRETLNQFDMYKDSPIYGPEVTSFEKDSQRKYMEEFVSSGGKDVVGALSWHHYYGPRSTTTDMFYNKTVLDSFENGLTRVKAIAGAKPVRLTETSSCFGGGAPDSASYVAGFMWLDKLGLSARSNVTAVYRQAFIRAKYGLIDRNLNPTPDYWLSIIFRSLVEGPVFNVTSDNADLRVYANCVRRDLYKFPPGALVLYYLNIGDCTLTLDLHQFKKNSLKLWALSPDGGENTSKKVRLNGQVMSMSGNELPILRGITKRRIDVAAKTFGFVVILNAKVTLCPG